VQKARRRALTTITIRTDWQTGQRDNVVLLSPGPAAISQVFVMGCAQDVPDALK
jgi:hypothetical protein